MGNKEKEQPLSPEEASHQAHLKSIADEIEDKQVVTAAIRSLLQGRALKGAYEMRQNVQ